MSSLVKLPNAKLITLVRGILAMRGVTRVVCDKNGNAALKQSDKEGVPPQPVFDTKPFDVDPKLKFAMARTLDKIRPLADHVQTYRSDLIAEGLKQKTARLRLEDSDAPEAKDLSEQSDPEHAVFVKAYSDFLKQEEEVEVFTVSAKMLRISENPDLSPDTISDLMPILTGDLE